MNRGPGLVPAGVVGIPVPAACNAALLPLPPAADRRTHGQAMVQRGRGDISAVDSFLVPMRADDGGYFESVFH